MEQQNHGHGVHLLIETQPVKIRLGIGIADGIAEPTPKRSHLRMEIGLLGQNLGSRIFATPQCNPLDECGICSSWQVFFGRSGGSGVVGAE